MCSKRVRHFNLVEITLAIAILAFGMANVLYLFPLGVNTSKDSIAENSIGDVSNYAMGYVKTRLANVLAADVDNGLMDDPLINIKNVGGLPTEKKQCAATYTSSISETQAALKDIYDNKNYLQTTNLSDGLFSFQKVSKNSNNEYVVDFACEIRMWVSPVPVTYRDGSSIGTFSLGKNSTDPAFERLIYMELSWPVDEPYGQREKRVFIYDAVDNNWSFLNGTKNGPASGSRAKTDNGHAGVI